MPKATKRLKSLCSVERGQIEMTRFDAILWAVSMTNGWNHIPQFLKNRIAKKKCSAGARRYQELHGGQLVYTVKNVQNAGMVCDHFMVKTGNYFADFNGNIVEAVEIGETINFGNGEYTVVQIVNDWAEFGINTIPELIEETKKYATEIAEEIATKEFYKDKFDSDIVYPSLNNNREVKVKLARPIFI